MGTMANSGDPDEIMRHFSGSVLFAETKSIFRERNVIFFENYYL